MICIPSLSSSPLLLIIIITPFAIINNKISAKKTTSTNYVHQFRDLRCKQHSNIQFFILIQGKIRLPAGVDIEMLEKQLGNDLLQVRNFFIFFSFYVQNFFSAIFFFLKLFCNFFCAGS